MSKIKLIFGTFNSQPMGFDDEAIEQVYQSTYKPFLTVLYKFPKVATALYYSGYLLEWLEKHHPEFHTVLDEMVSRRQVEILGGGYYEPVLPILPSTDRIGQIETMTTYIRKSFGKRPRGSWLTEQVWEPFLASNLRSCGMDYTFLDEYQFRAAAVDEASLNMPCITEDQGKTVNVFPISYELSSAMPYKTPEECVAKILEKASDDPEDDSVVVVMIPGERFGNTEETHDICYKQNWIEKFLTLVTENSSIQSILPGKYMRQHHKPAKRVYFECTSRRHLMDWMLPEDNSFEKLCSCGGFFRQVLTQYAESNLLYSKMNYSSILVNQLRGDKYRKKAAREELWKGQSHNPYWYSKIGGIYRNNLRKEAYRAFIEAEKITREKGIFIPSVLSTDFDLDGEKEFLYQGNLINAYVHVAGGMLFELDYLSTGWNYLDTLTRYADVIPGSKDIPVDGYSRKAFMDHFIDEPSIEGFEKGTFIEGGNFTTSLYTVDRFEREQAELMLTREGKIVSQGKNYLVSLQKKYEFTDGSVKVTYGIRNKGDSVLETVFVPEINLSLHDGINDKVKIFQYGSGKRQEVSGDTVVIENGGKVQVKDLVNKSVIYLTSEKSPELWILPVVTPFMTVNGPQEMYQSSCFLLNWPISLEPMQTWTTSITLQIK